MGKGRIGASANSKATGKNAATVKTDSVGVKTGNIRVKGANFYQQGSKLKRIKMLAGGKAKRNAQGKIIEHAEWASSIPDVAVARVEPDRRWFGNTRVIGQAALDKFRAEMAVKKSDPYAVLLRQSKLPMSLLTDPRKTSRLNLLQTESFDHTFGARAQRKRPKLEASSLEELLSRAESAAVEKTPSSSLVEDGDRAEVSEPIFSKGQSKRIWGELFKVIDSSDVLIHVLDARDPLGTRCRAIEAYITSEAPHKHLVFLLNKCDLIPSKVLQQWIKRLSQERPTLAFHASINNSFGRGALVALLRQFSRLHADKKQISVGFVGYPNVGKSSVINALRQKVVCPVAPIPGQTKVWQYVALMKRIYLIDCPGVVPAGAHEGSDSEKILRGVVRVENVEAPEEHITAILRVVKPEHISKTYNMRAPTIEAKPVNDAVTLKEQEATEDFLHRLAVQCGKLLKGGEPDMRTVAIMIINDFLRGRIPYFMPPPRQEHDVQEVAETKEIEKEGAGDAEVGGQPGSSEETSDEASDEDSDKEKDSVDLDALEEYYSSSSAEDSE